MAVTFYAAGDPKGPLAELALILSNNQAADFLQWLGLPSEKLQGSMWAADLIRVVRHSLAPAVVDPAELWKPIAPITHPTREEISGSGRSRGSFPDWARRLLRIAERAGENYVAWS